jgi:putative FmdB family regulatory protein
MPSYDYQCQSCRSSFTATHKINDPSPACPHCGGDARRKPSAPAIGGGAKKAESAVQSHGCGMSACGCKR